ncbi:MAG: YicC/YloC family endoribonuclease [Desulfatiglandaceae bacterium]
MINSMTAYGRADHDFEGSLLLAEIRSVNNRYRDIILRIPRNFQAMEEDLKRLVASRVRRGRIEVTIQMEGNGDNPPYELELNEPLVDSYVRIIEQLKERLGVEGNVRVDTVCQFKDVIVARPETPDVDKMRPGFVEVLEKALDSYEAMRAREGEALEADFRMRLGTMRNYVIEIEKRIPEVAAYRAGRLKERVAAMVSDVDIDEARLAQETAILAEKADITEELVRIKSHLDQFESYFSRDEALGRRFDFLIQEINREVNTLSTKASDALISGTVIEIKAELEKLREQVQNVE